MTASVARSANQISFCYMLPIIIHTPLRFTELQLLKIINDKMKTLLRSILRPK